MVEFPSGGGTADKKKGLTLALTDSPTVMRGVDFTMLFPYETAEGAIAKLSAAIVEADKAGTNVQQARAAADNAKTVLTNGQPVIAYGIAQMALQDISNGQATDLWIEAEQSPANSFHGVQPMPHKQTALALDSDERPARPFFSDVFV